MQQLLEKEGTKVENDKVTEFEKRFWGPCKRTFIVGGMMPYCLLMK